MAGRLLYQGSSWSPLSVDSRLLPSFLCPGPMPPPLRSEDCAENGPFGLLRTLIIRTLQVDLIYLFCEKEETENTLLFAGTQSCTQIKKDKLIIIETIDSFHTYKDTPRQFRIQEGTQPRVEESRWPQAIV